jgi:hypothetical protein
MNIPAAAFHLPYTNGGLNLILTALTISQPRSKNILQAKDVLHVPFSYDMSTQVSDVTPPNGFANLMEATIMRRR